MNNFLDSSKIVERKRAKLIKKITRLKEKGIIPHLAVISLRKTLDADLYLKQIIATAKELGVKISIFSKDVIDKLNKDNQVSGIVVQLPLPENVKTEEILKKIKPNKDVDALLWPKNPYFLPPTPLAILTLLKEYKIAPDKKKIVLLGYGRLVGKPLALMLEKKGFRPIICTRKTKNIRQITREADILISATGCKGLVGPDWVKEGVIIIDCGEEVKPTAKQKASWCTPSRFGLGPLAVTLLFENLIKATTFCKS